MHKIYAAQDLLARWIYTEEGKMPARWQRLVGRVNTAIEPWVRVLSHILDNKVMLQLRGWWLKEGYPGRHVKGDNVVYARIHLKTNAMYIGNKTPDASAATFRRQSMVVYHSEHGWRALRD